jgi:hypothetical protein
MYVTMYVWGKPLFRLGLLFSVSLSSEKNRKFISVPERRLGFEYLIPLSLNINFERRIQSATSPARA